MPHMLYLLTSLPHERYRHGHGILVQKYENENDEDPERLFLNSIKSNATKHMYLTCLQRYPNSPTVRLLTI